MALGPGCRVGVPRLLGEGLRVSTLVPNCPWERWGAEPAGKSAQPLIPDPGPVQIPGGHQPALQPQTEGRARKLLPVLIGAPRAEDLCSRARETTAPRTW